MTDRESDLAALTAHWPAGPDSPTLAPGEVHVWIASLDAPPAVQAQLTSTLSDAERARAARFRFERDARRYVVGRGMLRRLLGGYCALAPDRIRLAASEHDRPVLASAAPAPSFDFNLSHSEDRALFAFCGDARVGVDLERLQPLPDMDDLVGLNFSPREQAVWRSLPEAARERGFFDCWTRKEAFVKAIGEGLSHPLDSFDVHFGDDGPPRFERLAGDDAARWSLHALDAGQGFAAALAVERPAATLRCWTLPDRPSANDRA